MSYMAEDFTFGEKLGWTHLRSSQSVAGKDRARREVGQPAVTVTTNTDRAKWEDGEKLGSANARKITIEEAGVLQGFPADFPFQGSKTSQFRQVGNAVNPQVARAVLRTVL